MLASLGAYGFALRKWRTEPGLWMLALFLTGVLTPCWVYFEYLSWQAVLNPQAAPPGGIKAIGIRLSIDAAMALLLFATTIRLCLVVAIENWNRTRPKTNPRDRP